MKLHKSKPLPSGISIMLVGMQFVLIGWIALTGPLWPPGWWLRGMMIGGAVVGLWALSVMGLFQVNIFPEVPSEGHLIVAGPYRRIRHPMYTSVLLVTLAWVLGDPLPYRILLWLGLLLTLIVKLQYEERLLLERFSGYEAYRGQTTRLIPFVW